VDAGNWNYLCCKHPCSMCSVFMGSEVPRSECGQRNHYKIHKRVKWLRSGRHLNCGNNRFSRWEYGATY
jgi:hypothetical protein